MKKSLVLICLIGLFISSCEEETQYATDIFGKWDWIISSGGFGGFSYTPESTGDRIMIEYSIDSLYKKYRNDTLIAECKFHIIESETIISHEITKMIVYDNDFIRQSYTLEDPNSLNLYDEVYDGFMNQYKRIK